MRGGWFALAFLAWFGCTPLRPAAERGAEPAAALPTAADALAQAAECLERGDQAGAAGHLETHVRTFPEQLIFRAQLADLLVRLGRDADARAHHERFIVDARRATGAPRRYLVTAHTQLMEIASRADDRFAELHHRGAGLLLLVEEQEKLAGADVELGEEMICKALRALAEAKELNPADARTRELLAQAHDRAGNPRAAAAERGAARGQLVPGGLPGGKLEPVYR